MGIIELFNGSILGNEVIAGRYEQATYDQVTRKNPCLMSDERFFFLVSEMTLQVKMDFLCSCIKIKDIFLFTLELH